MVFYPGKAASSVVRLKKEFRVNESCTVTDKLILNGVKEEEEEKKKGNNAWWILWDSVSLQGESSIENS